MMQGEVEMLRVDDDWWAGIVMSVNEFLWQIVGLFSVVHSYLLGKLRLHRSPSMMCIDGPAAQRTRMVIETHIV